MRPQRRRAIPVGLGGDAVRLYVREWTEEIRRVTELAHEVHRLVEARELEAAKALLPEEREYPVPEDVAVRIGMRTGAEGPSGVLGGVSDPPG